MLGEILSKFFMYAGIAFIIFMLGITVVEVMDGIARDNNSARTEEEFERDPAKNDDGG